LAHFDRPIKQSTDHGSRTEAYPGHQLYRATLLIIVAISTYMSVPLLSGGRLLVPSFPTVALAPLLLLAAWPNLSKSDEFFLLKIAFVLLLSIALSPGYEHVEEKFRGLIQYIMSIGIAILMIRLMQQMRHALLERTLLVLWCLILIGSVLEVLGLTRDISDSFREWAYGGAFTLYDGDNRDITMVGFVRPKLFSAEPSHVTKFFIAAINSWLLVRITLPKVAVVAGATLIMLVLMGSPMLIVSAAITAVIVVWDRRTSRRARIAMILVTLLIGVIFGLSYEGSSYSTVTSRLASVAESTTTNAGSEERRMILPYMTLAETWLRWPLFGVGIGGGEVIMDNTTLQVTKLGDAIGNNALAETGWMLGLLGCVWIVYLLLRQAQQTGVYRLGLIVVIVALFSQLIGGIVTFRYWGFIALFWGALAVADSEFDEAVIPPST
jgi:hypothetical protein